MDSRTAVDLITAAAAIGAAGIAYTLGSRGREHRATIAGLQRAMTHAFPQIPGIAIGSAVLSASPGVDVGGDIVDVFELDSRFTLLLVADMSGKGVEAAAHTAFIKYTIRTLALESDGDPAVVVAKFNALYERTIKNRETFVVLILGIIDAQTGSVRYASAGHEPAFVRRRNGRMAYLTPTGPIVGATPYSAYGSRVVTLERGDVMVWTTDGMTESRDRNGRLLGLEGLAAWVTGAPEDVRAVADWLMTSLRQRSAGAIKDDDVAVLAVAYDGAAHRTGQPGQPPAPALPADVPPSPPPRRRRFRK